MVPSIKQEFVYIHLLSISAADWFTTQRIKRNSPTAANWYLSETFPINSFKHFPGPINHKLFQSD